LVAGESTSIGAFSAIVISNVVTVDDEGGGDGEELSEDRRGAESADCEGAQTLARG
jgi:hypothetical protein